MSTHTISNTPAVNPPSKLQLAVQKYVFLCFFTLICVLGIYKTTGFGAASLDYYLVNNHIQRWYTTIESMSEGDYLQTKTSALNSRNSHPKHPLYADMLGQVYEWGVLAGYESKEQGLKLAKTEYLKAVSLRPTWPVTYASLSMIKWRLNEFDDELLHFLKLANRFGPEKPEVNIFFSELGLALYTSNHPFYLNIADNMQKNISQGIRNPVSRKRVLAAVNMSKSSRLLVCRWMNGYDNYVHRTILKCVN